MSDTISTDIPVPTIEPMTKCPVCGRIFKDESSYELHYKDAHISKPANLRKYIGHIYHVSDRENRIELLLIPHTVCDNTLYGCMIALTNPVIPARCDRRYVINTAIRKRMREVTLEECAELIEKSCKTLSNCLLDMIRYDIGRYHDHL